MYCNNGKMAWLLGVLIAGSQIEMANDRPIVTGGIDDKPFMRSEAGLTRIGG